MQRLFSFLKIKILSYFGRKCILFVKNRNDRDYITRKKLTMVPLKTKMSMQPYQLITRYIHDLPEREREKKKNLPVWPYYIITVMEYYIYQRRTINNIAKRSTPVFLFVCFFCKSSVTERHSKNFRCFISNQKQPARRLTRFPWTQWKISLSNVLHKKKFPQSHSCNFLFGTSPEVNIFEIVTELSL